MDDVKAIDAVVNLWTPEALACRPGWGPGFFVGKMKMDEALMRGLSLTELIDRMDAAGIGHGFLLAHKSGRPGLPGCYHLPYRLVADAVAKHPDRFHGLIGIDPFMGMSGVRELESAVRNDGFIGAHCYPHWFDLAPDHAKYYPFYAKCVELGVPYQLQVGQSMIYAPEHRTRSVARPITLDGVACDFPELEADRHPHRHSVARRDDRHGVEASQYLHRLGRAQPALLAEELRALHQFLGPGQGDLRHRFSGDRFRPRHEGDRRSRLQAGGAAEISP